MRGYLCNAGFLARVAFYLLCFGFFIVGCGPFLAEQPQNLTSSVSRQEVSSGPIVTMRPRPEIPPDWPPGKRIVMHVTPSLQQSYVVACETPVPALTYLKRGHRVVIAVDSEAVTAFRRDREGKTPLDRLDLLEDDLDELAGLLKVPRSSVPKSFGELYRVLAAKGIRLVANETALRVLGIRPDELDPVVSIVGSDEFRRIMTDLDALLPYDETSPLSPLESIFVHRPH